MPKFKAIYLFLQTNLGCPLPPSPLLGNAQIQAYFVYLAMITSQCFSLDFTPLLSGCRGFHSSSSSGSDLASHWRGSWLPVCPWWAGVMFSASVRTQPPVPATLLHCPALLRDAPCPSLTTCHWRADPLWLNHRNQYPGCLQLQPILFHLLHWHLAHWLVTGEEIWRQRSFYRLQSRSICKSTLSHCWSRCSIIWKPRYLGKCQNK